MSRLPSPEQAKTRILPDRQGIHNARCKLIEAGENQTVKIAENKPFWQFSPQHIELVARRRDLRLERNSLIRTGR
jgi:hypothetical protein